jgi:hypothetical protein
MLCAGNAEQVGVRALTVTSLLVSAAVGAALVPSWRWRCMQQLLPWLFCKLLVE